MSEAKRFDATIVRRGDYRELRQPIRYERGRAVAYRCPGCGELHPLDPRDWDEGRGLYAGRACGASAPDPAWRERANARRRAFLASHPDYRARQAARARRRRAEARSDR